MTARINADGLRREIAACGLDMQSFARVAGISAATLSHAVNGRPIVAGTLRRITSALLRAPRLEGVIATTGNYNQVTTTAPRQFEPQEGGGRGGMGPVPPGLGVGGGGGGRPPLKEQE